MKKINFIKTNENITLNFDGQTHIIAMDNPSAANILQALKDNNHDIIPDLVSAAKLVENFSGGLFKVVDGQVLVDGEAVHEVLANKILDFAHEGLPYEPLVKFAKNVSLNPSFRAQTDLFSFLEKNNHPITEDGNFIAYKKVRDDFKDVHTGTMDNSPGKVVSMPRNKVNEDPEQTCSNGLHAANFDYASNFYSGGKMLELEINPKDVVAIPKDYNQSKMRVCEYKVLGIVDKELSSTTLRKKPELKESLKNDSFDCSSDCVCENENTDYDDDEDEDKDEDEYCVFCHCTQCCC